MPRDARSSLAASSPGPRPEGAFDTTHWTVVALAAQTGSGGAEALEELCAAYWQPLYAYVRRQGFGREEAEDITQGFFVQLINKKFFKDADRTRGRLRSFLLGALKHFLINHRRDAKAQKRGGGVRFCSMDSEDAEGNLRHEPVDQANPEQQYERDWVHALVNRVLDLLKAEHGAEGSAGARRFAAMSPHLLSSDTSGVCAEIAAELDMSEGAVRTALHRLRRRYAELFRGEVTRLVGAPGEVDDEIRHMSAVLAGRS